VIGSALVVAAPFAEPHAAIRDTAQRFTNWLVVVISGIQPVNSYCACPERAPSESRETPKQQLSKMASTCAEADRSTLQTLL